MFSFDPVTQTFLYFMYTPPISPTNDVHLIVVIKDNKQDKQLFVSTLFKSDGDTYTTSTSYSDRQAGSFLEDLNIHAPCAYKHVTLNTKSIKMATHLLNYHLPFMVFDDAPKESDIDLNKVLTRLRGEK